MKHTTLTICAAALLLFSCNNNAEKTTTDTKTDTSKMAEPVVAKETTAAPAMPDSATIMKNWQSYAAVGDMQKMMASWDGTWTTEMSVWEKPGAEPMKSTGKAINRMALGGRYQEATHTSSMMGMPFEGHSMLGYDNAKKVFQSTWADNMGTGIMVMTGPWDASTKSLTLTGKGMDPSTLTERDYREVFSIVDDHTQMMAMYTTGPDGKEMKMMEMKMTKK